LTVTKTEKMQGYAITKMQGHRHRIHCFAANLKFALVLVVRIPIM